MIGMHHRTAKGFLLFVGTSCCCCTIFPYKENVQSIEHLNFQEAVPSTAEDELAKFGQIVQKQQLDGSFCNSVQILQELDLKCLDFSQLLIFYYYHLSYACLVSDNKAILVITRCSIL